MAKYSFQLKLAVVQEYIDGQGGYRFLARKYNIGTRGQVCDWVKIYQEYGEEGLRRSPKSREYSVQLKLNAIKLYQTSEMSYREVASRFKLTNPSLIANWIRQYQTEGLEGLSKLKGRTKKMTNKKGSKLSKSNETSVESERIKEFEKQLRSLQIENAFLKELRKLRQQEERKRMKLSRKSSLASEDNSN